LRAVKEETFPFDPGRYDLAAARSRDGDRRSWFSRAEANADRASRAGFVLSMMFLVAVAVYAASLSGVAEPILSDAIHAADEAAFNAGFRLEDLTLSGASNTPRAALFEALELPYKKSSLSYDAAQAHERLSKIGWIASASVRRILPSRLEVAITERIPVARFVAEDGTVEVIDREGRVLGDEAREQFKALMLFAGEGAPAEASLFLDALSAHPGLRARIARAELVAERFWTATLDNGVSVKLPRKVNGLTLDRLESILANTKIAEMALDTIDLRLPRRTILQLRDATVASRDKAIAVLTGSGQPSLLPALRRGKSL
jgi:cell division protein FtsQ